ncbi:hypothetical protein AY599_26950 [Leptolyngbya valderiana BDU 20041]|uniref:hypothetical protein n=1 Tax=Baaleninema simplex TaxID=2862350 RepID=UPI000348CE09|nr:hypothetical protein [Baaleninema simplex]OAB61461.1 hypothetical protein AY599_26950 [Leptolyngbya valderiana BDU 20041]
MNDSYDSLYVGLVRNLAKRKRQALSEELGTLIDAIQNEGYTFADLIGATRDIIRRQKSGGYWDDCTNDLDRAFESALKAQESRESRDLRESTTPRETRTEDDWRERDNPITG